MAYGLVSGHVMYLRDMMYNELMVVMLPFVVLYLTTDNSHH